MKKTKILAIILIIITLFLVFASIVLGQDDKTKLELTDHPLGELIDIWYWKMTSSNNIYCIEHDQNLWDAKKYQIEAKVEIIGQQAKFYVTNKETQQYELKDTVQNEANNILGAVLTSGELDGKKSVIEEGEDYTYGYCFEQSGWFFSDAQIGLYYYMDDWITAVEASRYGFESSGFEDSKKEEWWKRQEYIKMGEKIKDQAEQKASQYIYKVDIYLVKAVDENGNYINYQNLIVTDPKEPGFTKPEIPVTKIWQDGENKYNTMPGEIEVKLLANGQDTGKTLILNNDNGWKGKFEELEEKDENGNEIIYTVEEISVPPGYESKISQVGIGGVLGYGFEITNILKTSIGVKKEWNDEDNLDDLRPASITVTLCTNGSPTEKTVVLSQENGWTNSFTNLDVCDANGEVIEYTVQEEVSNGYIPEYKKDVDENGNVTYTIINTHKPEYEGYIEINGKVWKDSPDGKGNDINGKLENHESGIKGIKVILKDKDGNMFDATSTSTTDEQGNYSIKVNYDNSQNVYKLYDDIEKVKEKIKTAYVEFEYDAMKYTTVVTAPTGADTSKAIENETIRNNFDKVHTTVLPETPHPDNWEDNAITAITKDVITFETYTDKETISREEILKYCNGDGTYKRTNSTHAWYDIQTGTHDCANCQGTGHTLKVYDINVETINNVNLGLFEREQPKVRLDSDISKVEVIVRNQQYTYIYNDRTEVAEAKAKEAYEKTYQYALSNGMSEEVAKQYATQEKIKVQFQNKDTYTYRRPINPADIAYLNDGGEAMTVLVTYKVNVGNTSSTLPITVHNITNYFDSRYTLLTEGWTITAGTDFNQATYNGDLNIKVEPSTQSESIELTYSVSLEAIKDLLNEDATLSNAVEIQSYSTQYGEKTLYAEQRTGGRTGQPYGGYDYESHPGNAGIKAEEVDYTYTYTDKNGNVVVKTYEHTKVLKATKLEDDTDIAPSFILCKDEEPKVLSGTVWEDTDSNNEDNLRLGNGKNDDEKGVANVKVELLKVNEDGTMTTAYLYHRDADEETRESRKKLAVAYTDSQGNYSFGSNNSESSDYGYGVVTDTYVIKFTYGEEGPIKDARNYKSTIISPDTDLYNLFKGTMSNDEWHLNLSDGYSVAVDDMQQRILIEDLQYSNFNNQYNMTAYSKPFKLQLEFDPSTGKTSAVSSDGKVAFGNELKIFDFGIIERAREDLFVENTIEDVKITLANGQILMSGSPKEELNYAKAIGFNQNISTGAQAKNALDKQIRVEIDTELIQGAQLDIKYAIKVTNNSEKDYEYYVDGQIKTEYYYFGTNNEGSPEVVKSVNTLINYLDPELTYTWENASDWQKVEKADDLRNQGYISQPTYNVLDNKQYLMYTTNKFSELKSGETKTDYVIGQKVLANQDENVYDNHSEILKIDKSTARTIKESRGVKEYKMGNYVPSLESRKISTDINQELAGYHEQDDDRVCLSINPPTGATNYITIYIIAGLFGLVVIGAGIIFIKKKILTK